MTTISTIRRKTGLSQAAFAKKFDISLRTLQQWEQGRSHPPAYVQNMICAILALQEQQYKVATKQNSQKIKVHKISPSATWKVCIDNPFDNCEKIYPIQQKKVRAILDMLEKFDNVRKIIIFGSSVTPACHVGSDVDIYVELSKDAPVSLSSLDFETDLWTNYTVDDRLKKEIYKKGVVVYEQ